MPDREYQETVLENSAILIATILGTVSYLMAVAEYWSWWIVLAASFLAFPAAIIVAACMAASCDDRLSRGIVLVLGCLFLYGGLTEPNRLGTLLMGIVFLLIGTLSRRHIISRIDASDQQAADDANGQS